MDKLIVTCAITGGASPENNPYLPKTPAEQVQATIECYNAGASVVHIHARNPETGRGEQKAEWFAQAIAPIRQQCDIIVNVTTGGSGKRVDGDWLYKEVPEESVKGRIGVVPELCKDPMTKPDLASFNAGSPVIDIYNRKTKEWLLKFVMVHSFPDMVYMAETMKAHGVKPELECYDIGMINNARVLGDLGHIEPPLYFQCVLGVMGQIPATVDNLITIIYVWCKIDPELGPKSRQKFSLGEKIRTLPEFIAVAVIFFIVIGGIMSGLFTPTEAGTIGTIAVLILALLRRSLTFQNFIKSVDESLKAAVMVLFLIASHANKPTAFG